MLPKIILFLFLTSAYCEDVPKTSALRLPLPPPNKVADVTTICNASSLEISVIMDRPYKGMMAAKDFSQECGILGTLHNLIKLILPSSGCGVRLASNSSDGRMYYSVNLVVQQDRFLRQVTDQEIVVRCYLQENALTLKSEPMFLALKNEVNHEEMKENRVGRMRTGWKDKHKKEEEATDEIEKELKDVLSTARAWMEISPAENKINSDYVQVGEPTLLSVKSTLPAGIGWRVVDCSAHDGSGDGSQKLLDHEGCPVDEQILPGLTMMAAKVMGENRVATMRHQEAIAHFPAFKFPDRDRLHVSCGLQLCRGKCIDADCRRRNNTSIRGSRKLQKGERGEVLDRLEVFNSVEVLAPGIELDASDVISGEKNTLSTLSIPGDRTFCVSPNKMALAFCVLGIVFLIAVIVALWSLLRARRSGVSVPYYTRSLFSSSSGSGSYGGSKLLLHESPCLGQTRHWRVL